MIHICMCTGQRLWWGSSHEQATCITAAWMQVHGTQVAGQGGDRATGNGAVCARQDAGVWLRGGRARRPRHAALPCRRPCRCAPASTEVSRCMTFLQCVVLQLPCGAKVALLLAVPRMCTRQSRGILTSWCGGCRDVARQTGPAEVLTRQAESSAHGTGNALGEQQDQPTSRLLHDWQQSVQRRHLLCSASVTGGTVC